MGNVTINHWKIIQAMLERGVKPDLELIELALDKADPMPDDMQGLIKRIFIDKEKGLLSNRSKRAAFFGVDIYLKIIRQEYGDESATEFKARTCKEKGISGRALDSQVAIVKSILGFDTPKKTSFDTLK
jgi:hypothetical protein